MKVQWDLGSPSFIGVLTCCSCLENQTAFLFTGFNFSSTLLSHIFHLGPLNGKLGHLRHVFYAVFAKRSTQHLLTFGLGNIEYETMEQKKTVNAEYLVQSSFSFRL